MFKTLEELKEKYPIGYVYRRDKIKHTGYAYNERDIEYYKSIYKNVKFKNKLNIIEVEYETIQNYSIQGYIFDGDEWYPAVDNWDGWITLTEEDMEV